MSSPHTEIFSGRLGDLSEVGDLLVLENNGLIALFIQSEIPLFTHGSLKETSE